MKGCNSPSRTRTYDLAVNPGVPGLALPIEQMLSYPASGLHRFDLFLTYHRFRTRAVRLRPPQLPRTVLSRVLASDACGVVVFLDASFETFGMPNVESTVWVLEYVRPEWPRSLTHNSPSRTRTYDLAVNSRSLYQLSYRGLYFDSAKTGPQFSKTVCQVNIVRTVSGRAS